MAKRSTRLAATGLALGAALSLLGTAGSAEAAAQGMNTTVQSGSNLREAATTNSRLSTQVLFPGWWRAGAARAGSPAAPGSAVTPRT